MLMGGKKMPTELPIRRRVLVLLIALGCYTWCWRCITALTTVESISLTQQGVAQWTRDSIVYARREFGHQRPGAVMSATAYIVSVNPGRFRWACCPDRVPGAGTQRVGAEQLQDKTKASVTLKRQVSRETVDALLICK